MKVLKKRDNFIKTKQATIQYQYSRGLITCIFLFLMNLSHEKASSVGYELPEVLPQETDDEGVGNNYSHLDNSLNDISQFKGSYQMMPMYGYVLAAVFLFTIWILGTAGNFMVPYLVFKNKPLRTPMNLFLVNLSIADFTMAAFGSPISFSAAVLGGWPFGDTICVLYGFGMALGGIASITTLMVLAFERFLMIARPFRAADIQNQHSVVFIIAIWMYSLTLTVPPLIGWASYGPEAAHLSCSVNWEKDDVGTTSYIFFLFIMGLILPLITIVLSYVGIVITIRQTGRRQSARSTSRRAELHVIGMVATMVASFMIAWLPYSILSLIVAFSPTNRKQITPFIAVLPSIFAKSSSCYNPLIYVGLNSQFRTALVKLLGLQRSPDEEGTAMTMSATGTAGVNIPVDLHFNEKDDEECQDLNMESTFINKPHPDSKLDKETLPLLHNDNAVEMESMEARIQTQHHQHSNIPNIQSEEMEKIQIISIDQVKTSSTDTLSDQISLGRSEKQFSDGTTITTTKTTEINGDGCCKKNNSSTVKFVDDR